MRVFLQIYLMIQANTTLLGITGLDFSQEITKKLTENETATNRRIENVIGLLE